MHSTARSLHARLGYALILFLGITAQPSPSDAAEKGPGCSPETQTRIADLCPDGFVGLSVQKAVGAEALLCMPPPRAWSGDFILHARGTTRFRQDDCKLASVVSQLDFDEASIPQLANELGFGFATSSCSEDVLAVKECKDAMLDLTNNLQKYVNQLERQNGNEVNYGNFMGRKFLTGVSLGGLVATQLIEGDPDSQQRPVPKASDGDFDGGLAACGPIGDLQSLIRYQGDLLVLTDCLYRDRLADPPLALEDGLVLPDADRKPVLPESVLAALDDGLCADMAAMIDADPARTDKILRIMATLLQPVPLDPSGDETVGEIIADIVCSDTLPALLVFEDRFGGNPYDNSRRLYLDLAASPGENLELNRCVHRFEADATTEGFETSGQPMKPLVTLHTLLDPRVPYRQNLRYSLKVSASGNLDEYVAIPSANFGHCAFDVEEVVAALGILFFKVWGFDLLGAEAVLKEPEALGRFYDLVNEHRGKWRP